MWVVADMYEEQLQVSGRFTQNFIACMDLPTLFTAVKPLPDYWRYVTNSSICVDGGVLEVVVRTVGVIVAGSWVVWRHEFGARQ